MDVLAKLHLQQKPVETEEELGIMAEAVSHSDCDDWDYSEALQSTSYPEKGFAMDH